MTKFFYAPFLLVILSCTQGNKNSETAEKGYDNTIGTKSKADSDTLIVADEMDLQLPLKEKAMTDTLPDTSNNKTYQRMIIPENYTKLKESPANGRKMGGILTDLDHDQIIDTAFIASNENEFADYLLLIYLSSTQETYPFKLIDTYSPDFNLYPVQLKEKNKVLEVGYYRDGTARFGRFLKFRFDEKKKNLRLIGYDSGYKPNPSSHRSTSYNLLNGSYIVEFDDLMSDKAQSFKGRKTIKALYIDDIELEVLNQLDEIGNEFENPDES